MKKLLTVFLVIGIIVVIIGIVLVVIGGTLGSNVKYTDEAFASEGGVEKVELDVAAGTANVEFYDGDVVEITYQAHPRYGFTAAQSGGTVKLGHERSGWFSWSWWRKAPVATVKIPYTFAVDLDIDISAGSVKVQSGEFKKLTIDVSAGELIMGETVCSTAKCHVSAGSVKLEGLTCGNTDCHVSAGSVILSKVNCPVINLHASAGSVKLDMLGNKEEYTILVDKSAGSCNVSSQQGTDANKKIDIDVSAGSIEVNFN